MALLLSVISGCAYVGDRSASVAPSSSAPSGDISPEPTVGATDAPPGVSPSNLAAPSPTPVDSAPVPSATTEPPSPPPTQCCEGTPLPSLSHVTGLRSSNEFWSRWVDNCFFGESSIPSSLAEVVRDADLIVRGPIVDLYVGEQWTFAPPDNGTFPLAYVRVQANEVLKGTPMWRNPGYVEVQFGQALGDWADSRTHIPAHDHVWFLTYIGLDGRDEWNQSEIAEFGYYTRDEVATVLREVDGVVRVLAPDMIQRAFGRKQFPLPFEGTDFEDLVDQARELATGQSRSHSFARWSPNDERDPNRFAAC